MFRDDLENINDAVARIRRQGEENALCYAQNARESAERDVQRAEAVRHALMLLVAEGIEPETVYTTSMRVELGYFKTTKGGKKALAHAVRKVRLALGCRLELYDKSVEDAKKHILRWTLHPVDFPGVSIVFTTKLPASAKCRIVKTRSTYVSLQCDVE